VRDDIWDVLGLDPDADERAIRRAYARRLKTTNPEDDAAGFQALRNAYEAALREAAWRAQDEAEEALPSDDSPVALHDGPVFLTPRPAAPRDSAADLIGADQAEAEAIQQQMVAALEAGDADRAALLMQTLLASPANDNILYRSRLEGWLAHLVAGHLPHSEAMVEPLLEAYGWSPDDLRPMPDAAYGLFRWREDRRWINAVGGEGGELFLGWQALTRSVRGGPRWARIDALRPGVAGQVSLLLGYADHSMPVLDRYFDADRVAWWRNYLARPRFSLGTLALVPAILLIGFIIENWVLDAFGWSETARGGLLIGAALCALAAPFAYLRWLKRDGQCREFPEQYWQRRHAWLAAPLLYMLVAGLLPTGAAADVVLALLGLVIAFGIRWAIRSNPPILPFLTRLGTWGKAYGVFAVYVLFHVVRLPEDRVGAYLIVVAALLACWAWGIGQARHFFLLTEQRWRAPGIVGAAMLLTSVGTMLAIWGGVGEGAYRAALAGLCVMGLTVAVAPVVKDGPQAWVVLPCWVGAFILWFVAQTMAEPSPRRSADSGRPAVEAQSNAAGIPLAGEEAPASQAPSSRRPPPPVYVPAKPKPWVAPVCPPVDEAAPLPAPAIACGEVTNWFRSEDYPASALRRETEGTVRTRSQVDTDGRITGCEVEKSSGDADLDDVTCSLLMARGRFVPARDAEGKPISTRFTFTMTWQLAK
jgi:TonB family protein